MSQTPVMPQQGVGNFFDMASMIEQLRAMTGGGVVPNSTAPTPQVAAPTLPAQGQVVPQLQQMSPAQMQQQVMQQVHQPAIQQPQQQPQVQAPSPTRGSAANPTWADERWGVGTSDKMLGYSTLLSALAGATAPREGGGIMGSLGRAGGAMGPMMKGEMASRNAQDQRVQQYQYNQQMLDLYKALLSSKQGASGVK